jgi:hypothetical protein
VLDAKGWRPAVMRGHRKGADLRSNMVPEREKAIAAARMEAEVELSGRAAVRMLSLRLQPRGRYRAM